MTRGIHFAVVFQTLFSFAAILCAADPPTDLDGWDKAKWGMREEEILKLYGKEAKRLPFVQYFGGTGANGGKDNGDWKFYTPIEISGVEIADGKFAVRFVFDRESKTLIEVALSSAARGRALAEREYGTLEKLLTEKYGPRTYGNSKADEFQGSKSEQKTALWKLKKTLIDLKYTYSEAGKFTNLRILYTSAASAAKSSEKL